MMPKLSTTTIPRLSPPRRWARTTCITLDYANPSLVMYVTHTQRRSLLQPYLNASVLVHAGKFFLLFFFSFTDLWRGAFSVSLHHLPRTPALSDCTQATFEYLCNHQGSAASNKHFQIIFRAFQNFKPILRTLPFLRSTRPIVADMSAIGSTFNFSCMPRSSPLAGFYHSRFYGGGHCHNEQRLPSRQWLVPLLISWGDFSLFL